MSNTWSAVKLAFAAVGAAVGSFLGGVDKLVITLILFVVIDYITGVVCALLDKRLNSEVGARGIAKKVFIFLVVGMAHMLDANVLGGTAALRTAIIFFYLANEGLSVFENAVHIGLPVPDSFKSALEQLKKGGDKSGE